MRRASERVHVLVVFVGLSVGGMDMKFVINSVLLGVGLAMDAFSVSIVNGLNECHMTRVKSVAIAGTYAAFQFAMPMIGWFCVYHIATMFQAFQVFIPWIALLLLLYIGGKMLFEGLRDWREASGKPKDTIADTHADNTAEMDGVSATSGAAEAGVRAEAGVALAAVGAADCVNTTESQPLGAGTLFLQGVATSIDALSVGFTIATYNAASAFLASILIAMTTFIICMIGLLFGKHFGDRLADKATILGGVILILIGVEIFMGGI